MNLPTNPTKNIQINCPVCTSTQIKQIVYGLPDFNSFDFEKFKVGGCCITKADPRYCCSKCGSSW